MKLCSIVGDLPIKSNTFGLFSFERVKRATTEHSPRHTGDTGKMQGHGSLSKLPSLNFSSAPIRVQAPQCPKVQTDC